MKELNKIKGYWDSTFSYNFDEHNMWEGKILLYENGWFEGIVVDPYSSYTEDRFIFGIYHPDKVIELYKFTPLYVSSPFVFHASKEDNGYNGQLETIGLFGPTLFGVTHITTQPVKENVETETEELENRIKRYKETIMDEVGQEFYDNSISIKNALSTIILGNYEGKQFTNLEIQEIMKECQPVNEKVMESTNKAINEMFEELDDEINDFIDIDDEMENEDVKKLSRKKYQDFLSSLEDELPFN